MRDGIYYVCELCSTTVNVLDRASRDWDWFTGSLDRTHHFCPTCKQTPERNRLFAQSREEKGVQHDN